MASTRDQLEDISRDLDMVVFRLERDPGVAFGPEPSLDRVLAERCRLRRDLEELRDRLEELTRGM